MGFFVHMFTQYEYKPRYNVYIVKYYQIRYNKQKTKNNIGGPINGIS